MLDGDIGELNDPSDNCGGAAYNSSNVCCGPAEGSSCTWLTFQNCVFWGNTSPEGDGGAVFAEINTGTL